MAASTLRFFERLRRRRRHLMAAISTLQLPANTTNGLCFDVSAW